MPTDKAIDGTDLSELEEGKMYAFNVRHNTAPDRSFKGTVTRLREFGGGTEVRVRVAGAPKATLYGDFWPPIVEQAPDDTDRPVNGRLASYEPV